MDQESTSKHDKVSPQQREARKKQVGVWLDQHQAFIIAAVDGQFAMAESFETTEPEHNRTSEHTINKAEKGHRAKHYHSVAAHLGAYDHILLFGPGTAQEEMRNLLSDDVHFRAKKIVVDSAGHMTQNQMVAKVRDFFDAS